MSLTYKEQFLQQKSLEDTLYKRFGYQIESMNAVVQRKKKVEQYPTTANIKLRNVAPSLYRNSKIQQIEQQINEIQRERLIREEDLNNSNNKANKNPEDLDKHINKMNNIINQYNYLVDHKHIKDKGSDENRKIMKIKPKTTAEKAVEEIESLKPQLYKANIQEQYAINKRINSLYKLFKNKIDEPDVGMGERKGNNKNKNKSEPKNHLDSFRLTNGRLQESHRANSIRESPKGSKAHNIRSRNQTMGYSLIDIKNAHMKQKSANYLNMSLNENFLKKVKSNIHEDFELNAALLRENSLADSVPYPDQSPMKKKTQQLQNKNGQSKSKSQSQQDIEQPYVPARFIESGQEMDIKIRNNMDALELWKGRISEAVPSTADVVKPKSKEIIGVYQNDEDSASIADSEYSLKEHVPYVENKKRFKNETADDVKSRNKQQEEILSQILEKKKNKYVRPWGTRILMRYNAGKQAKDMLGLSPTKDVNSSQVGSPLKSQGRSRLKANQSKVQSNGAEGLVNNLQNQLKVTSQERNNNDNNEGQQIEKEIDDGSEESSVGMDWDKQIDQEYYWTMCKNEKINLLFKGKKKPKVK